MPHKATLILLTRSCLALLLLATTASFVIHSAYTLRSAIGVNYSEAVVLRQSRAVFSPAQMYPPIESAPFVVGNYPPLYPVLTALLDPLLGQDYLGGRILSLTSTFLLCLLLITWNKTLPLSHRLGTAALFLSSPYVYLWASLYRVDMLGLLLSVLGLFALRGKPRTRNMLLGLLCFLASLLTKPTLIAAPLAAFVYLARRSGLRTSLTWGGLLAGAVAVVSTILNRISEGEFILHVFRYNANAFELSRALYGMAYFIGEHFALFALATWALLMFLKTKQSPQAPPLTDYNKQELVVYYLLFSLLTALAYGKLGSDTNYFLEPLWACSLLALAAFSTITRTEKSELPSLCLLGLLLLQIGFSLKIPFKYRSITPTSYYTETSNKLIAGLKRYPSPILCEQPAYALAAHGEIYYQPFIMTQLAWDGVWDQSPIIDAIESKKFSLLALEALISEQELPYHFRSRFTDEMIEAMRKNYVARAKLGQTYIYQPTE